MKPQHKRRVGEGLSLEKFAKSKTASFDKTRLIQKQRIERIKRSKQYSKAKKKLISEGKWLNLPPPNSLDTQIQPEEKDSLNPEQISPAAVKAHDDRQSAGKHTGERTKHVATKRKPTDSARDKEETQQSGTGRGKPKKRQKISQMQALANNIQQQREAVAKEKEEARAAAEQRQARLKQAEKQRKSQKSQYFKKTKRGQPVMKYRVDKILQQLGAS